MLDHLQGLANVLQIGPRLFLDHRQAIVRHVVEVIENDAPDQIAFGRVILDLQEQTLAQIAGGNAWRVELLHDVEHLLDAIGRCGRLAGAGDFEQRNGQEIVSLVATADVADPVDERDDVQRQRPVLGSQFEVGELLGQMVLKRLRPFDDVLHRVELAIAQFVERGPARPMLVFVECAVPVAIEGLESLEFEFRPRIVGIVFERRIRVEFVV